MYEVYQDHPKQARLNIRVVLAVAFLVCAIGAGIFLITRLVSKPLTKEDARGQTGIVYDSSASRAAGIISARKKLRRN